MDDKFMNKVERVIHFYKYNKRLIRKNKYITPCFDCKRLVVNILDLYTELDKYTYSSISFDCEAYCIIDGRTMQSYEELDNYLTEILENRRRYC